MKKKIVFTLPTLEAGGMERVVSILSNFIQEATNYEVHIILLTNKKIFYKLTPNVIVHQPNFSYKKYARPVFLWKTFFYLRNKIKCINPIVVFSFGGRFNGFVILSSFGLKCKIFVAERSQPTKKESFFIELVNKISYRYCNGIIVQTQKAREIFELKYPKSNIFVIPNPVECTHCTPFHRKSNIILNVGRFIPTKNQITLIEIFSNLNPKGWELHFVGDGPELEKCKNFAQSTKCSNQIVFHGKQKNVFEYYSRSKIFCFTSTSEGFPNVLLEAMCASCAVISFDCEAGPSDIIKNDYNGILITDFSKDKYQEQLSKMLANQDFCEYLAKNGNLTVQNYNLSNITRKFINLIEQ